MEDGFEKSHERRCSGIWPQYFNVNVESSLAVSGG